MSVNFDVKSDTRPDKLNENGFDTFPGSPKRHREIARSRQKSQSIKNQIIQYSDSDETILLKGETGTGKSYTAELIHCYSGRRGRFKVVNTPGIPENLFESELFGHTKGAFTGADRNRKGLIREAEGGTLFIDEITEVPVSIQAKLLRFVETKKYSVLGESDERTANVRIVAATNKNIADAIKQKEFREDLYFRINIFEITLLPLRERTADMERLVCENLKYLNGKKIGPGFWNALYDYDWPGNIREMVTVLKRAGFVQTDSVDGNDIRDIIRINHFDFDGRRYDDEKGSMTDTEITELLWADILAGKNFWDSVKTPFLARELNRSQVKKIIRKALIKTGGTYKGTLALFGLRKDEYKNFMRFLHANRLQPERKRLNTGILFESEKKML